MKDAYSIPTELIDKYPVFEANQVLSSGHLNTMRDYLSQQERLTRSRLIGTGILYGLQIVRSKERIEITPGAGITTEGYLINIEPTNNRVFTKFKQYSGYGVAYNPFQDEEMELWELLTEDATGDGVELIANNESTLENTFLLLYVEIKPFDFKTCFSTNCDDKGGEMQFKVRKLLVNERFREKLFCVEQPVAKPQRLKLPIVRPQVVNLTGATQEQISNAYLEACSDKMINELASALRETYNRFDFFLSPVYGDNPFDDLEEKLKKRRNDNLNRIQYFYDFILDLIKAYDEFRGLVASLDKPRNSS